MTPELAIALFNAVGPMVRDIIVKLHDRHGRMPTEAEIRAEFNGNVQKYLDEGQAWTDAHPG